MTIAGKPWNRAAVRAVCLAALCLAGSLAGGEPADSARGSQAAPPREQWRAQIRTALFIPNLLPPLEAKIHGQFEPEPGVVAERVTYATQFGLRVPAIVYLPKQRQGKVPGLVVVNGHGGDKYSWYAFYAGVRYARAGAAVLTFDPLGEGERHRERRSGTCAHDQQLEPRELAQRLGGQLITDMLQAVAYLRSRPEVDPRRVGAMGYSLGSFLTALTGAIEPTLRACVLTGDGNLDGPDGYWDRSKPLCQGRREAGGWRAGVRPSSGKACSTSIWSRTSVTGWRLETGGNSPPPASSLPPALDFPNWTEDDMRTMQETHISRWARALEVALDPLYAGEEREGGTRALGEKVPALSRAQLSVFSPEEWEREKGRLIYESWVEAARAQVQKEP